MKPIISTSDEPRPKIWLSWSSGKDSYAALCELRAIGRYDVDCMFTAVDAAKNQVPMHAIDIDLLTHQADALGIRHRIVDIGGKNLNDEYINLIDDAYNAGVGVFAFGDLFLEEIRRYREKKMSGTGIDLIFPIWEKPPDKLISSLIDSGMRAIITSVDLAKLPASFLGRELSVDLVADIAACECDLCGENGEFHSFVFDGPLFRHEVNFEKGDPIIGKDFAHLPLTLARGRGT